nr:hypothetical protein [Tanacetum cinerariifolium]
MIQPEPEGSTQGYPLVSVEVLRYDKRSKSKNMGIVPTEMELILEHTQQGISHEVSVTPTKPRRMTKPYSSHRFIANRFNARHLKMEVKFYGFAINQESARDVYSKRRIIAITKLKIVEWHNYNIVIQRRMEDLQLGVESYQKKLNLTKLDSYRSDLKHKEAYIAYSNLRGFIYQNKDRKNGLMRIDELHKFSDGMLINVRTALDDRLKGIRMQYLPQSIWRKSDKDRATAMIQAIDKRLKPGGS